MLRTALTSTLIRLGPAHPLVRFLIDRKCRAFGARLTHHGTYLALRNGRRQMRLAPKHFVYAPDMARLFDTYFSALVPAQIDGYAVLDYSRPGTLQTYASSGLQFEMASFPEEEDAIDGYFHWYRPHPGDMVFDVGAHCGVSTYVFSELVGPAGRVIAFEPDPVNFSLLKRNIVRHSLVNVVPVQLAVAGSRGEAAFSSEATIGSRLVRQSTRASVGRVVTVGTVTLEDAFLTYGTPAFCKIDIEGSELEVIAAARSFLRTKSTNFALDTNHLVGGTFTDGRIEELFRECGFECTSSSSGMKTTWARAPLGATSVSVRRPSDRRGSLPLQTFEPTQTGRAP